MSSELVLGVTVGHGTYGVVRRGERTTSGVRTAVAIKVVQPDTKNPGVPQNACREIGLLRELKHPHIVNLLDVLIDAQKQRVSMVLEWADYDLHDVISQHRKRECEATTEQMMAQFVIPLQMIRLIMYQLLDATEYIHSQWVMHRDIKLRSFLFSFSFFF